jgi:hypothetical protein
VERRSSSASRGRAFGQDQAGIELFLGDQGFSRSSRIPEPHGNPISVDEECAIKWNEKAGSRFQETSEVLGLNMKKESGARMKRTFDEPEGQADPLIEQTRRIEARGNGQNSPPRADENCTLSLLTAEPIR